ncbi:unnamed protein product, partial [Prorocentrum cordatum]
ILLLCHSSGSARASAPPFARFPGSGPATKTRPGQHLSRSRSAEAQANLPQILGEEKRGDGRRRRRRRRRNEEGGGSKREETSYPPSAAPGRALPRAPGGARRGGCTAAMRGGAAHGRFRSEAAWPEAGPAAAASKATETCWTHESGKGDRHVKHGNVSRHLDWEEEEKEEEEEEDLARPTYGTGGWALAHRAGLGPRRGVARICAEAGHIAGALRSTRRRPNPRESGHPEAGTTASTGGAAPCRPQ